MNPQDNPTPTPAASPEMPAPLAPSAVITPTVPTEPIPPTLPEPEPSAETPPPAAADPAPKTADSAMPTETAAVATSTAPPPAVQLPNPKTHVSSIPPVTEPGERTLFFLKRHPIGILGVYVMCALVLIVTAALAFVVGPGVAGGGSGQSMLIGALVFVIVAVVCIAFALVASKVYWGNSWTLTNDSITQISRVGLFKRDSSQLSLENLEDVTAEQNGILTHVFNYGVLRVETASESGKFMFNFCPNPNYYAQQVLQAHEAFERNRRAEGV